MTCLSKSSLRDAIIKIDMPLSFRDRITWIGVKFFVRQVGDGEAYSGKYHFEIIDSFIAQVGEGKIAWHRKNNKSAYLQFVS